MHNTIPLVSWTTGTILIGVFALVCIGLIAAVYLLMSTDKKKKE